MRSNIHEVEVQFQYQTERAVCIRDSEDGDDVWIPKSRCEIDPQFPSRGQVALLISDESTLTEKGLL